MSFSIRILTRARADFRCIFSYIEENSPEGARRWRAAFEDGLSKIRKNPLRFGLAPEDQLTNFELRQLLFKTRRGLIYRAIFAVLDDEVLILRLRGPGQMPLGPDEMPLE